HQPCAEEHDGVRNGIGCDRRYTVDEAALDALEEIQFAVGAPETDSLAATSFRCRLSGTDRHLVVHAEHAIDLRLALQDSLADIVALLAVESPPLTGADL